MKNIKWVAKHKELIETYEQAKNSLLRIRGLDKDLVLGNIKLKDLLKDPKSLGIDIVDLKNAYEILFQVLNDKKGVIIHGDYDVDGITSTTILYENLLKIGFEKTKIITFLPNRFDHGYGFSEKSYEQILQKYPVSNFPLIILTDCGITAINVINKARKDGYKVILIDHHQKKEKTPKVDAIFWNSNFTASVLSYLFCKYMEMKFLGKADLNFSIDLAALGFLCDLGNLTNPVGNLITKYGIISINKSPREGIRHLLALAGLENKQIKSYELGWIIGPRLNASGRLEDASISLNLLMGENANLNLIASELTNINSSRQDTTKKMYEDAIFGLSSKKYIGSKENEKVIVVDSDDFHEGVIGLVSGKLVKEFYKPSIAISWQGDKGKGSVRSVEGVDITKILGLCSDCLIEFGGHTMAAGFGIERRKYADFLIKITQVANDEIDSTLLTPTIFYDFDLSTEVLNEDLLDFLDDLEPYGNGNPRPLFAVKNIQLDNFNIFGKEGEHFGFKIKGSNVRAVYFGQGKLLNSLTNIDNYNVLFSFEKNEYKGQIYPQILVKDLRPSEF